ncbi:hypothetical protein [Rathayibacter sp. VKM Ac-2760]|uniref:hypothetical protein n=1 Tax=Rathayibacter sp. VKM Ac-2760 TaxID=2609253 RepID=UPI001ABE5E74|nr:hypothetical protein [Rathayibacter sp. VKM Ac-2760]
MMKGTAARPALALRRAGALTLAILLIGGLTACAPQRSAEAFCSTMQKHKDRYLEATSAAQEQGAILGLLGTASAVGDLSNMWKELAEVAPDEIRTDAETVRDAWAEQQENAGALDWVASLSTALFSSASMSRVDAYVRENCDGLPAEAAAAGVATAAPQTTAASPTTAATAASAGIQQVGSGFTFLGPFLVRDGYDSSAGAAVRGAMVAYVPQRGAVTVDAEDLLPAEEVLEQSWTFAGEAAPYAVGLVEVRKPASGLDPEQFDTALVTVDVTAPGLTVERRESVSLSGCRGMSGLLLGSSADAVAVQVAVAADAQSCSAPTSVATVGFDPSTGAELWRATGDSSARGFGGVVLRTATDVDEPHCAIYDAYDIATGSKRWSLDTHSVARPSSVCGSVTVRAEAGSLAGGLDSSLFRVTVDSQDGLDTAYSIATGAPVVRPDPLVAVDALGGSALSESSSASGLGTAGIAVTDLTTGAVLYSIDPDRVADLDARARGLLDGILYVETSDQDLAIDVATGTVVDEAAAVRPLGANEKWVYFDDGALVPRSSATGYAVVRGRTTAPSATPTG